MPAIFRRSIFTPEAEDGGLLSLGPDLDESYRRAAAVSDAILKGKRPADLPIEEPTRLILALNLKTAAGLAITTPPAILVSGDRVVR